MAVLKDVLQTRIMNAQTDLALLEADLVVVSTAPDGEVQAVIDQAQKIATVAAKYL